MVTSARAEAITEDDAVYRAQVEAALGAYQAVDLAAAHAGFEAAHARYPNARTLRGLGTVELEQGDFVAAATHLEQAIVASELPLSPALRSETEGALKEANEHVGRVLVLASPADAQVRLDQRLVPRDVAIALAPGVHELALAAPGYRSESRQLMVSAAQSQLIHWSLTREEAPPPVAAVPPPARRDYKPWLVIGAGAAAFVAGGVVLALGIHDYRSLDDQVSYGAWRDTRDRYPRLIGAGGALLGAGALAAGAGWWWHTRTQDVRVSFGVGRVQLRARF